jgi:hypothetical protein
MRHPNLLITFLDDNRLWFKAKKALTLVKPQSRTHFVSTHWTVLMKYW